MTITIRPLLEPDQPHVLKLLSDAALPVDDVNDALWSHFIIAERGTRIVGAIAIEPLSGIALLRSLVVAPAVRGHHIGRDLVNAVEAQAQARGITRLALLTNTAEDFFARLGYARRARESAPPSVQAHAQFRSLCPASAAYMEKDLAKPKRRVLVLCTGNSARSILAEALLNHLGGAHFMAVSAGSRPAGLVNPLAIEMLKRHGIPIREPRSKSWGEFAAPDAPPIDIVITVCGNAAGETCPIWPGHPITAHWGVDDPAAVRGSHDEKLAAFEDAFRTLRHRVEQLCALDVTKLDDASLKRELERIGRTVV